ncbi:unnamed protein product, partial [marine sediment metagenome]
MKTYNTRLLEKESDVTVISDSKKAILRAKESFYYHRKLLEKYIKKDRHFLNSFSPIKVNTNLRIINNMAEVAEICDVGPMASVAGALADLMLEAMKLKNKIQYIEFNPCKIALIENGGEIAVDSEEPIKIALYAGENEALMRSESKIDFHDYYKFRVSYITEKQPNLIFLFVTSLTDKFENIKK